MKRIAISMCVIAATTTIALAASPIKVTTDSGDVIAGSNTYRTLYVYAEDSEGMSNCYDECADKWPPHVAEYWDTPRPPFSTIERKDGKKQWAKDGMPLYFSTLDEAKGDTKGEGVDGLWTAARP
ncbi:COG4315 family predicted lipoprotein [Roseibium sp.]|uniref:COG4315 family predicted lipoprotein n=1 Tax=Roseibium sp. TaxID=1936156 RepID=UPI003D1288F3